MDYLIENLVSETYTNETEQKNLILENKSQEKLET